jgi:hypothetical protein
MNRAFWVLALAGEAGRALLERVADWQLANLPADRPRDGWVQAAGDTGLMALSGISRNPRYDQAMMKTGADHQGKPAALKGWAARTTCVRPR